MLRSFCAAGHNNNGIVLRKHRWVPKEPEVHSRGAEYYYSYHGEWNKGKIHGQGVYTYGSLYMTAGRLPAQVMLACTQIRAWWHVHRPMGRQQAEWQVHQ